MKFKLNSLSNQNILANRISIQIVDDHKLVTDSLSQILNNNQLYTVVATSSNAGEGIRDAEVHRPDILITDVDMPGMSGVDAIELIKKVSPLTKIIGMSMHSNPGIARKMIKSGALGYVTKSSPLEELYAAIQNACSHKKYLCDEIKNILTEQFASNAAGREGSDTLSPREFEIIDLLKRGYRSKEIGIKLNIATKTVEVHRYKILKKLKLRNVAALVNYINSTYSGPAGHSTLLSNAPYQGYYQNDL